MEKRKQYRIYKSLRDKSLPFIKHYHKDLLFHDKKAITKDHVGVPFLHFTGECGTYIVLLQEKEFFPAQGVILPFLFGTADRENILDQKYTIVKNQYRRTRQDLAMHYDGFDLREVSLDEAKGIAYEYRRNIMAEWRREEE